MCCEAALESSSEMVEKEGQLGLDGSAGVVMRAVLPHKQLSLIRNSAHRQFHTDIQVKATNPNLHFFLIHWEPLRSRAEL